MFVGVWLLVVSVGVLWVVLALLTMSSKLIRKSISSLSPPSPSLPSPTRLRRCLLLVMAVLSMSLLVVVVVVVSTSSSSRRRFFRRPRTPPPPPLEVSSGDFLLLGVGGGVDDVAQRPFLLDLIQPRPPPTPTPPLGEIVERVNNGWRLVVGVLVSVVAGVFTFDFSCVRCRLVGLL